MLNLASTLVVAAGAVLVLGLSVGCGGDRVRAVNSPKHPVTFNSHIQPILSENCYQCHGPDSSSRKGGLRLDRPEFALKGGDSGKPAIVAGEPNRSQVMRRILSKDPLEVMPPPESHNQLELKEGELVRQWIEQGAAYEEHWAFIAPRRPVEPKTQGGPWARHPIDRFILARLEQEGLQPAREADRATWIRRVSYDLTGLPPTPEEAAAFVADGNAGAYERVVDRLLASPRYGEHRARYWLDVARYGDSHGLHGDYERSAWPYRDYVIRAFNQNTSFDQFTRENLAGDLLPPRNLDQQLASAYIRMGISSGEGGSISQELRVNNQRERVEAYGAAFLGLTTGCAACHDHKFDPLSQKDHYQLTAFFNNLTENPNNQGRAEWPPYIQLPVAKKRAAYDRLLSQKADLQMELKARRRNASALVDQWLQSGSNVPRAVATRGLQVRLKFNEGKGNVFTNSAPGAQFTEVRASGGEPVWGEDTWFWPSMRMETTTRIALTTIGDVESDEPFTVSSWIMPRYETARFSKPPEGTLLSRMDSGKGGRGWELYFKKGLLMCRLVGDGELAVETLGNVLSSDHWTHVLARYDGSRRAAGLSLYVNGQRQELQVVADTLSGSIRTPAPLLLARRQVDDAPLRQTSFQDFRFYGRDLGHQEATRVAREDHVSEIVALPRSEWNEDERHAVAEFYFAQIDRESRAILAQVPGIDRQLADMTCDGAIALVSEEAPRLAYADVLDRGSYSQRTERVRPAVPHFLPQMPADASADRLGLAEWTVSSQNPLTARVTVNRMWAELFGSGLVETTEDFGIMGARPSHPELLDWLAVEFRESGWNVKNFYRMIVLSATYRQSPQVLPEVLEKDPGNRLLARGPRYRLDAEMLRDTVLATSGLLVEQLGGPSVKPYQPSGIWEAGTPPTSNTGKYEQDHGAALYRRSLYTFWKRMGTMPNMDAFDAPVRDVACTRRQRTTTPLQALVAMNDVQWLEGARKLAERLLRERDADDPRLDHLGEILLARRWNADERSLLVSALEKFRDLYSGKTSEASELMKVGESPPDPSFKPVDVAVWMLVASTAQNLDATLNK